MNAGVLSGWMVLTWLAVTLATLAWVCALANAVGWRPLSPGRMRSGNVSVLIPARNEAANIGACLASVRGQDCVREILVCDDHSTDSTAEIVQSFAREDPRTRLLQAPGIPPGWGGKTWACATLARHAQGDWLLFVDADVRLQPGAVSAILDAAERYGASFVSAWPGLDMVTLAEQWAMPMLNFVVFTLFPAPISFLRWTPSLGLAHGACILARRDVYDAIGGHQRVRGEMFEDTLLARVWRASGHRSICVDGQRVVRVRMYDSLAAIWRGFGRVFYPAFRTERSFWLFWLFHAWAFLAPFALCLGPPPAREAALLAAGLVWATRLLQAVQFRFPVWSTLLHPFAEAALLALGLWSRAAVRSGRGLAWKGRVYAAQPTQERAVGDRTR